jgi:hypothetical protein
LFAFLSNFFSSLCSFLFVNHSFCCCTFFSLCYCVVFSICFEENDTKVCLYNYESCHKINTLGLFYYALVATVYEWLIQISSCIMARTSYLRWWCFVLSWILILLIFCVMFYRSLIVLLSLFFRQLYCQRVEMSNKQVDYNCKHGSDLF